MDMAVNSKASSVGAWEDGGAVMREGIPYRQRRFAEEK